MRKQSFDRVRKTLCILLAVLLLVSLTAASASAWYNKKGEVIAPPEKAKEEKLPAPKETKVESVPTPVVAEAPNLLDTGCDSCNNCDWGCENCDCDNDKTKIAVITAVRVGFAKGDGCFDRKWW